MDSASRKKKLGHLLELAFLLALVLPPLVQSMAVLLATDNDTADSLAGIMSPQFSTTLLQGALAVALFVRSRSLRLLEGIPLSEGRRGAEHAGGQKKDWKGRLTGRWGRFAATVVALAVLLANSILWNWLSQLGAPPNPTFRENGDMAVQTVALLLAYTAVAAFYEEMVYRWYSPLLLGQVLDWKGRGLNQSPPVCLEGALVVVFALSHSYGGWPAVGNAFVAGSILRACILLTDNPFSGFAAHLVYNLIQLFLLLG